MKHPWKTTEERAEAYKNLFDGPNGERILEDFAVVAGHTSTTFNTNPTQAAFNEGQRAFFVAILNTVEQGKRVVKPKPQPQPLAETESEGESFYFHQEAQ